jgi:Domain of unknown function (DUF4249)
MKYSFFALLTLFVVFSFSACNLEKEIEIDLPDYKAQAVVECYLEPGKPPVMLLTQSSDFFAPFDTSLADFVNRIVLQGATAVVRYNGITDTLINEFYLDAPSGRFYNYVGSQDIPATPETRFDLEIKLADGNTITSSCVMVRRTPIDSVVIEWDPNRDTLARALTYITDDKNKVEYWRRILNYGSLNDSLPEQDFLVRDNFNANTKIAFGDSYILKEGDTVFNTIHSVTEDYLNYLESVQLAVAGSLNPFASPSPIKSNVQGTSNPMGIFSPLVYDRVRTIVMK